MRFANALDALYQAPLDEFIAERKKLAAELDKSEAKQLLARRRPPISAWVVNQLWWHARDAFDALMGSAEKLRKGDMKASAAHRDAIAKLRARASAILKDAGHAPTEGTLRRVTTTLSALAVSGWEPDEPGTLSEDRDPPGFAAFGVGPDTDETPVKHVAKLPHKAHPKKHDGHDELEQQRAAKRAAEQEEKRRAEAERKRIAAERHRVEAALRTAKAELRDREHTVKQQEKQLEAARDAVDDAQKIVDGLTEKLESLERVN